MDRTLKEMATFFSPKMNPLIMKGYVCHEMKSRDPRFEGYNQRGMEERIEATFRKAFHGLLDGRLSYEGLHHCTPQETFEFETRPKNTKRFFELARSDIYLVRAKLTYKINDATVMPLKDVYLYLPNPGEAGLIRIGGPLFQLIPIVTDKVISPENDYLFVRLEQYKMKFYKNIDYPVKVNGIPEHHAVYWANIYLQKQEKKKAQITKAYSTLAHYLFARLGVSGAFKKFLGFTPVIGNVDSVNLNNFPDDTWMVCSTAFPQLKPPTAIGNYYTSTRVSIAIPKNHWNEGTKSLVHALFYILDAFPDKLTEQVLDDTTFWKLTLGYIISDPRFTIGKVIGVVEEHFNSTDTYMDDLSIEKLAEKGFHITDFTDLLGLIATRYKELYDDRGQSQVVTGKYLDTIREMLFPITCEIYNTKYQLMKQAAKGPLTFNAVNDIFTRRFKPRRFFQVTTKGIVAELPSYSGDHYYPKITSRLSQQEATPGTRSSKGRRTLNDSHYLNTSQMMAGSILFLSKKKPIPMSHANPFCPIDPNTGTILQSTEFEEDLKRVDEMLLKK